MVSLRREPLLQLGESLLRNQQRAAVHHVVDVDLRRVHDLQARDVAPGEDQVVGRLVVHEQRLAVRAELHQDRLELLRLGLRDVEVVDDLEAALLRLLAQGRAQRGRPRLLGHVVRVVAGHGAEHGAAVPPERRADLPHARAAGALLPPGLAAGAADQRAVLGHVRPAPPPRAVLLDRLVEQVRVDAGAEDLRVTHEVADLLVVRVDHVHRALGVLARAGSHRVRVRLPHGVLLLPLPRGALGPGRLRLLLLLRHVPQPFLMTTYPPLPPGTDPLTTRMFFSPSTRTTVRLRWVTLSAPMWQAARMPLSTREGKAEEPMDPGAR